MNNLKSGLYWTKTRHFAVNTKGVAELLTPVEPLALRQRNFCPVSSKTNGVYCDIPDRNPRLNSLKTDIIENITCG